MDVMQGENIVASTTSFSPTFGGLFLGSPSIGDEWSGGRLQFFCDRSLDKSLLEKKGKVYVKNYLMVRWQDYEDVDCLVVRQPSDTKLRSRWMSEWCNRRKTQCLVVFHHEREFCGTDDVGNTGKELKALGYNIRTWHVKSELCGAATWSDYVVTMAIFGNEGAERLEHLPNDLHLQLPPRACGNIVIRHYEKGVTDNTKYIGKYKNIQKGQHPIYYNFKGTYKGQPVYTCDGPFPSDPTALIYIEERGNRNNLRCLQEPEWKRLKLGVGSSPMPLNTLIKSIEPSVLGVIGTHVWNLLRVDTKHLPSMSPGASLLPPSNPTTTPPLDTQTSTPAWDWVSPTLGPGTTFRWKRMASLQLAVSTLPAEERSDAYSIGIRTLDLHSHNYTSDGPKHLVLLWWEWDKRHWDALRNGISMNFMKPPKPGLIQNQKMNPEELKVATAFVEELRQLGVIERCADFDVELVNNFPLFLVPKPGQPGQWRCIANGKDGNQNEVCVGDPCMMTSPNHILPHLYEGGYSAILDMSKYFHMFNTVVGEWIYLGLLHPVTGEKYFYARLPMGTRNSPAGSGRLGACLLRHILDHCPFFQGNPVDNSLPGMTQRKVFDPVKGEGRVLIDAEGEPCCLVWLHVDDLLLHGSSYERVSIALSWIMDEMVRLGLICQRCKIEPPSQRVKFCGFIYDTSRCPTLEVPTSKISKGLALISFLERGTRQRFARLTLAMVVGMLQSLVEATPGNIGASFLRGLYQDLHQLEDGSSHLRGTKSFYFTSVSLSVDAQHDLEWWRGALSLGLSKRVRSSLTHMLGVTWGDGSGVGLGGTFNWISLHSASDVETWLGVWKEHITHVTSSNWKELCTLKATLENIQYQGKEVNGFTIWYLTDNSATYDVCRKSYSKSPKLMRLIREIRLLELELGVRLMVIHCPGRVMISQGTDGLSRGVFVHPLSGIDGVSPLVSLFRPALPSHELLEWALHFAKVDCKLTSRRWLFRTDLCDWSRSKLLDKCVMWCVSPHFGKQCMLEAMSWVESPLTSGHLFILPRIFQRDFGRISKFITFVGQAWEAPVGFTPVVPFVVYYLPPFSRSQTFLSTPSMERPAGVPTPRRVQQEIDALHRMLEEN